MDRRKFMNLTATATSGTILLPSFLQAMTHRSVGFKGNSIVFLQLDGGNDGLNTYIPYADPLYQSLRPTIGLSSTEVINKTNGMGLHPALKGISKIQQAGHLSTLQNVGYPDPVKSHFRSKEIWQTGSNSSEYLRNGWLGRYLDQYCDNIIPTAGINVDRIDNLALKGAAPNSITIRNPRGFKSWVEQQHELSGKPALDFARTIAVGTHEGSKEIQKALKNAGAEASYPKSGLGRQLQWIAKLIKGDLGSKIYYTSLGGFDTHDNQLGTHNRKLEEVDQSVFSFYEDLKNAGLLDQITLVVFSEFGRRVADNGSGTDHGTAAPVFIVGGGNQGRTFTTFKSLYLKDLS